MIRSSSLSRIALLAFLGVTVAGWEVVGGIFQAGFWVGAIGVILVVLILGFIVAKARG